MKETEIFARCIVYMWNFTRRGKVVLAIVNP